MQMRPLRLVVSSPTSSSVWGAGSPRVQVEPEVSDQPVAGTDPLGSHWWYDVVLSDLIWDSARPYGAEPKYE